MRHSNPFVGKDDGGLDFLHEIAEGMSKVASELLGNTKEEVNVETFTFDGDRAGNPKYMEVRNADRSLLCIASYCEGIWRIHFKKKACLSTMSLYNGGTMKLYNHREMDNSKDIVNGIARPP